jgi:hypothetical protein
VAVFFLVAAGLLVWGIAASGTSAQVVLSLVAAIFLYGGVTFLRCFIRIKRVDARALVLDDEGIEFRRPTGGRSARVPWDQVSGVRETRTENDRFVGLDLRAPLSTFLVPPNETDRWERFRNRRPMLAVSTNQIDTSGDDLIKLIKSHLPDADATPGTTGEAFSHP